MKHSHIEWTTHTFNPSIGCTKVSPGCLIVGGESGHGARPMAADWVRALRDQCAALDVPFFFAQWGCHDEARQPCSKKDGGRRLDGQTHDGWPRGFEPLAAAA